MAGTSSFVRKRTKSSISSRANLDPLVEKPRQFAGAFFASKFLVGLRPDAGQADPAGGCPGKLLSPVRRRACIEQIKEVMHVSERRACAALGQHRSTQRKMPRGRHDEERLTADLIAVRR